MHETSSPAGSGVVAGMSLQKRRESRHEPNETD